MKILISGYYGFDNIGDEAVLGGIIEGLRAELPDARPVVLSGDPESTRQLHGVDAIPRMDLKAIKSELRDTDIFISGGGSLLQDVTSFRSPLYYLGMLHMAQRAKVPTMMLAQGVGPLRNPINRFLARRILNRTLSITVRDGKSAEYLRNLGVNQPPIEVTADPSFLLTPDNSARIEEWWAKNIPAGRPVIGVALREWPTGADVHHYQVIADALAELANESGALILLLPMQPKADLAVAVEMNKLIAESRVFDSPLTPCEMLAIIGRCDFITAMRLHALIFAVHQCVPAFGISYDPKVRDFADAAKLPVPMAWEELDRGLSRALLLNWESRAALQETLKTSSKDLTALARLNIERVKELLLRHKLEEV